MSINDALMNFKFQSDSINTSPVTLVATIFAYALNSNLILLIHIFTDGVQIILNPLNSNLILLIHRPSLLACGYDVIFKFQSDSINTRRSQCCA